LHRIHPRWQIFLIAIRTRGDSLTEASLAQLDRKGLFVKEIEEALGAGTIDLAVHSLKDLPTELPDGLCLAAITAREDPRDCLISRRGHPLERLPRGARIGTSSPRRQAQLRHFRPDLCILPLRGNLETRIRKLTIMDLDAIILAAAGLQRMGRTDLITQYLSPDICLPAAGQGSLGIEARKADRPLIAALVPLQHPDSVLAARAERAFLRHLGGGCQIPIAALAEVEGKWLRLRGMVADSEGENLFRDELSGPAEEAEELGRELARRLWARARPIFNR
jgi:hydroxymethylbilane synthase